jgi:hypothetical protein
VVFCKGWCNAVEDYAKRKPGDAGRFVKGISMLTPLETLGLGDFKFLFFHFARLGLSVAGGGQRNVFLARLLSFLVEGMPS